MNITKKTLVNAVISLLTIPLFAYLFSYTIVNNIGTPPKEPQTFSFGVISKMPVTIQFFYNDPLKGDTNFTEQKSLKQKISTPGKITTVFFKLPEYASFDKIRIDFGDKNKNTFSISSVTVKEDGKYSQINTQAIAKKYFRAHDLTPPVTSGKMISYTTTGNDPYILLDDLKPKNRIASYSEITVHKFTWIFSVAVSLLFFLLIMIITARQDHKKYSFHKILLISSAFALMLLPIWGMRYKIDKDWKSEKRKLAEKKPYNIINTFDYSSEFEKYFNDNFGYRKLSIYQYNYLLYKIFKQSPLPENIMVGRDEWLFYGANPDVLKFPYFTDEQLVTVKNNLEKRRDYFNKKGIKFYVLIAPEKINIYNEYFPGYNKKKHSLHKLRQLDEYLKKNSDIVISNCTEKLLREKSNNIVFYKQDTHWNDIGAFWGYRDLMDKIRKDFPDIPVLTLNDLVICEKPNQKANISAMIGIDTTWKYGPHLDFKNTPSSMQVSKYKESEDEFAEILIKQNKNKNLPKALIFHDSFGDFLTRYISESFGRSVFIFSNYIDESVVDREKPDVVIYELSEARINLLLKY